jgi:UDP-glucose 4-epimerase
MDSMRNVLVTGGAGFIGHHLVEKLSETDSAITIVDNLSNANANFLHRVKSAIQARDFSSSRFVRLSSNRHGHGGVSIYVEDIRNKEALIEIFKAEEIDTCVHLAAKISVPESITNPEDTIETNIKGTFNVLEACSKVDVKNFVFASSSAVYGEAKVLPISENQQLNPLSPYGASKIAGEALVSSFRNAGKIQNSVSLRMFNVFGEGQSSEYAGVISRFAERLSANLPPVLYGDGNQTRDFISVDDVADVILLVAGLNKGKKSSSDIDALNVGTGIDTKIKDLAQMMIRIFNLNLKPSIREPRCGDIMYSVSDINRLRADLGFEPPDRLECYLRKMTCIKKRDVL